jgi:hypothetical protein
MPTNRDKQGNNNQGSAKSSMQGSGRQDSDTRNRSSQQASGRNEQSGSTQSSQGRSGSGSDQGSSNH